MFFYTLLLRDCFTEFLSFTDFLCGFHQALQKCISETLFQLNHFALFPLHLRLIKFIPCLEIEMQTFRECEWRFRFFGGFLAHFSSSRFGCLHSCWFWPCLSFLTW